MTQLQDLEIRIESPSSDAARGLIDRSEAVVPSSAGDDFSAPNAEFLVARLGGTPVGCIALLDHVKFGEARRLYVADEARGNGIALALVEALEEAARDIGLRRIRIAQPAITDAALRPFSRRGYRVSDASPGGWMEKAL